jgi:hypothetical protein
VLNILVSPENDESRIEIFINKPLASAHNRVYWFNNSIFEKIASDRCDQKIFDMVDSSDM